MNGWEALVACVIVVFMTPMGWIGLLCLAFVILAIKG